MIQVENSQFANLHIGIITVFIDVNVDLDFRYKECVSEIHERV